MFNKRKNREKMIQMVQQFTPTSKASLKQFCIVASKGNIDEATKLYDFYMKDMDELPMTDPVPPTWVDNTKNAITGIFDFVKEHQDGLSQGYEILRGIMASRGKNLPPLGNAVNAAAESLPPIN